MLAACYGAGWAMANDHDTQQPQSLKSRFSPLHTRTFEAELVISGAVVFGLFQLAPVVTGFFEVMGSRLEGPQRMLAIYGQMYFSLVIYVLIGAFLLHVTMRAFWIGLLGLESVFPDGVRWDRLRAGPFFIQESRRRLGPLSGTIERLDDLCSLIFSFGFMIVVVFLYSVVVLLICAAVGSLLSHLVFDRGSYPRIFWITFGVIFGVQILGNAVDRMIGARVQPDSVVGLVINRLVAVGWLISPFRWIGQIQLTLQSNTSNTRVSVATFGVVVLLGLGFIAAILFQVGVIRFDSMVYFPNTLRAEGIDPRHYRALRSTNERSTGYPSIQSDIVEGPYLTLSIPYSPRRHNQLVRERCPEVEPFRPSGFAFGFTDPPEAEAAGMAVDCLASLFSIELDGSPLDDAVFEFTRETASGREAIVTYIRIDGLSPGRHQLVVLAPSREMAQGEGTEPERHVIPFWR